MLACRPMLSFAVALMAGILVERHALLFASWWPFFLVLTVVAAVLFVLSPEQPAAPFPESLPEAYCRYILPRPGFFARRGLNRAILLFCLVCFFLGMARQALWHEELDTARLPDTRWFNARLVAVRPSHVHPGEKGIHAVPALLIEADGKPVDNLPVRLRCKEHIVFRRGDIVSGRVKSMGTSAPAFPGAFDYGAFLEKDGLLGTLEVLGHGKKSGRPALTVQPVNHTSLFIRLARHIDNARAAAIRGTLAYGGESGGLLAAMLFGYRKEIDESVRDAFRRVGIGHVLAISGLHVGLVVAMLWWLGGWFGWSLRWRALACLGLTVLYWGLTGGQVAATRATLMAVIHLAGMAAGRRGDMLNSLGAAAFIIAMATPFAPLDVSFQLSFVAVVFIYITMKDAPAPEPDLQTPDPRYNAVAFRRAMREVRSLVRLSVATWIGLFPVIALVFNQVNLAGLPINIIVIPLMSFVLAGGLLLALFGWIPGLGWLLTLPARILTWTAAVTDAVPGSSFPVNAPSFFWVVAFYLFIVLWMIRPMAPAGRARTRVIRIARWGMVVTSAGLLFSMRSAPPPENGRIAILPGAGFGVIAAEAPGGDMALVGTVRRGGINEASWLRSLHRNGPVAVVTVGKATEKTFAPLAWQYPVASVSALSATSRREASLTTEWQDIPGITGIQYAYRRNEKGRVYWLTVRTGDKTAAVSASISIERFREVIEDVGPEIKNGLASVYFSDARPRWDGKSTPSFPVGVRGRMPADATPHFFRRNNYGVILNTDAGLTAYSETSWHPLPIAPLSIDQ